MFSYFHEHKFFNNSKGQMLPVFILVLVVIIIMAMVTINIGKIGLIKTDSSNAADAGALAAGATMSNTFNSIAVANSQLEAGYWEFFAEMSTMFATGSILIVVAQATAIAAEASAGGAIAAGTAALGSAGTAAAIGAVPLAVCVAKPFTIAAVVSMGGAEAGMGAAEASMGTAVGSITGLIAVIIGMMVSVTAFTTAQNFFYLSIRKMAEEGRKNAIKTGHQYLFNNSGITSKLKRNMFRNLNLGNWQQFSNYQQAFSMFMKFIVKDAPFYVYAWIDGQNRPHTVTSGIDINPVDKFKLKVSVMPYPAEMALLGAVLAYSFTVEASMAAALAAYSAALGSYTAALASYTTAKQAMIRACAKKICCFTIVGALVCCPAWIEAWIEAETALGVGIIPNTLGIASNAVGLVLNAIALLTIPPLYLLMFAGGGSALAGLLPGPTIVAFGDAMGALFIICWIDDIIHDRLVRASTTQTHGEGNLTLWNTRYPLIQSYSIVNFNDENRGSIHPPNPRHDSSIIWTDIYLPEMNPQNDYCNEVQGMVDTLNRQIESLEESSASLHENTELIENTAQQLSQDTSDLTNQYNNLAGDLSNRAEDLQNQSDNLQQEIEQASEEAQQLPDLLDFIEDIVRVIAELIQNIIDGFSAAISTLMGGISTVGGIGNTLNNRVGESVGTMTGVADQINAHVDGTQQDEINRLQDQVNQYMQNYPQCFGSEGGG